MKKSKAIIILLCALLVLLGVGYVDLNGVDAASYMLLYGMA